MIMIRAMLLMVATADAATTDDSNKKHPNEFTADDVANFLHSTFGNGSRGTKLLTTFQENEIDGSLLTSLTKGDLTHDLKLTKLQARKFKLSLDELLSLEYSNTTNNSTIKDQTESKVSDKKETSSSVPKKEGKIATKNEDKEEGVKTTTSNADTSGVPITDNDSKENSKETTVTTDVDTQPDTTSHHSTSTTKDDAATTKNSTKDNKETITPADVDTKPNDTTTNSLSVTMDDTDKEGSKSNSEEDKEEKEDNASTTNNTTVEYCTELCEGQKESKKYKQVLVNGNDFRQAVREWSSNPESSPYGPILGCWDVSLVNDMSNTFLDMKILFDRDQNLQCWDTSSTTTMDQMFAGCTTFNEPIGDWNVSKVTSMAAMFDSAVIFNKSLTNWNVSNVRYMNGMFFNAKKFDNTLGTWNVHNVHNMAYMFAGATSFNQDIGSWDVFDVEDTESMFDYATSFNQNLGDWHIGNVHNMNRMFNGASKFDQDLCGWTQFQSVKSKQRNKEENNKELFKAAGGRRGRSKVASAKLYNKDATNIFEGTACPEREDNDPSYTSNWCRKCTK
mmetsp:Transcript_36726/g.39858  ORF Transcript_36726/g.39858 Transcript_36726/m.39858 type:complete len:562 (-) Transcript_36726:70-1755(-)